MILVLIIAVVAVALTNGANANFKCVASLYGSGTLSLRSAAHWGTGATFLGSVVSVFLGPQLLQAFGGKGIVDAAIADSPSFVTAVALGAAVTSFLGTRLGFPVSTTHALLGAIAGAGIAAGGNVQFLVLLKLIALPLFISPLLALLAGWLLIGISKSFNILPEQRSPRLDVFHIVVAVAASFARGLNDTPKMAALALAIPNMNPVAASGLIGVCIAVGGLVDYRRVAVTLGTKITTMNAGEGFLAGLVTSLLVSTASVNSLPVSTTHVSVGSLVGIGLSNRQARWKSITEIAAAWLVTVPVGAFSAWIVFLK